MQSLYILYYLLVAFTSYGTNMAVITGYSKMERLSSSFCSSPNMARCIVQLLIQLLCVCESVKVMGHFV